MSDRIRIFLVDDHPFVRDGVKHLVNHQTDMEVVGEASDGATACSEVARLLPDIVIMDMTMPQMNGARATAVIRKTCPQVKVIALTVNEDKAFLHALLDAGVTGYVVKRAASDDLIRAIRIVHGGNMYLDPAITSVVASPRGPLEFLHRMRITEREKEVLVLIAKGYLHKEIGDRLQIGTKTVETHKSRACEKLGLGGRAAIVQYVRVMGWLEEPGQHGPHTPGEGPPRICGDEL
jgi:two-component system, NarL family, response regulator NreC